MHVGIRLSLASLLLASLWLLALPLSFDVVAALCVMLLAWRAQLVQLAFVACSLVASVSLAELVLRSGALGLTEHYREHERFVRSGLRYEPNVRATIAMPHGDLVAVDPHFSLRLAEPRRVLFVTDSLGYRNEREYSSPSLVLLGDSFAVGNGTSQEMTLPEVLARRLGHSVYSLAHPADPIDYEYRANWFLQSRDASARFWMVVYEGNDFVAELGDRAVLPAVAAGGLADRYREFRSRQLRDFAPWLRLSRVLEKMVLRVSEQWRPGPRTTEEWPINGSPLGVFRLHELVAKAASVSLTLDLPPWVWERVDCVLFVPTKGRVYATLAGREAYPPSAGLSLLRSVAPRPEVIRDLTPALETRARELASSREFVYWRDDTHWNARGIEVASEVARSCPSPKSNERLVLPAMNRSAGEIRMGDRSYRVAAGAGAVESKEERLYVTLLSGWAVGAQENAEEGRIVAVRDGKVISQTRPRLQRPDIAERLGPRAARSGFVLGIPPSAVSSEPQHVEIYYLGSDGSASEVSGYEGLLP